jgi:hypothetical protein
MNYGGWHIHVVPFNDNQDHAATLDCWCEPVENEDGTIVHNASDNREAFERGERKLT